MPNKDLPKRIRMSEALRLLKPYMCRSTFYGDAEQPGPRWTMLKELDIRDGLHLTLDRTKFDRWLSELQGEPAVAPHQRAGRLGPSSERKDEDSYGERIAALVRAHEAGLLSREQLERALEDLN